MGGRILELFINGGINMKYQFKTTATMKVYNNKNWWIDPGIVREITVEADNIKSALDQYRETVQDQYYINISKSALKNKSPMYRDTADGDAQQCGYVITGSTDFNDDNRVWVTQYIDLWVTIHIVSNPFTEV
jgi:hypothetical protein